MRPQEETCEENEVSAQWSKDWRDGLPPLDYVAEVFRALSDETRLSILYLLSKREMCVREISQFLDTTVSNISHHLRLLRALRLVRSRREGKRVCYALDDEHVVSLLEMAFLHAVHQ